MKKILFFTLTAMTVLFGCKNKQGVNPGIPETISEGQNFTGKNFIEYSLINSQDCEDLDGCIDVLDVCSLTAFADSVAIIEGNGEISPRRYDSECIGSSSNEPYTVVDTEVRVLGVIAGNSLNKKEKIFFDEGVAIECATGINIASLSNHNGYNIVRGCISIDMATSEPRDTRDINLLPNNFEDLSFESQSVIGRYLSNCREERHFSEIEYNYFLNFFSRRNSFIESSSNCEEIPAEDLSPPNNEPTDDTE